MNLGILQARLSSTRLPGKVLKPILGKPLLFLQIERILRSTRMERFLVATSTDTADDEIETLCTQVAVPCFRGSLDDVLDRFYQAARMYEPDHVIRLTGDCPLTDPLIIDEVIGFYQKGDFDYVSNALIPSFPDGLDIEVFSFDALMSAWKEAVLPSHREHVTLFINQHPERFRIGNYTRAGENLCNLRWTVDEPEDFELVRRIYEALYPRNPAFTTTDILEFLRQDPSLNNINAQFVRNAGLQKSREQDRLFSKTHEGGQRR